MAKIDIHNTFSPSQEIIDPDKFAGRKSKIAQAIKALARPGTSILVYGDRGVGKTSFVEMVKLIAQDQVELIHRYGLKNLMPDKAFQYKVAAIECDDEVGSIDVALQRLITSPEGLAPIVGPRIEKMEGTIKDNVSLSLFKSMFSYSGGVEEKVTKVDFQEKSIFELFTNLIIFCSQSVLANNEGLLIVIDEFDKITDKSKMGSLIKTLSKNKIKFLIAGIAESYEELIHSHASIERQLFEGKILIEPMIEEEINQLFDLVQSNSGSNVILDKSFRDEAIRISNGYPFYVQLFGQVALDHYFKFHNSGKTVQLTRDHLKQGLKELSNYNLKYEKVYKSVIQNDPKRELLLKALAIQLPVRIQQSNAFRYCEKRGLKIPKPSLTTILAHRDPRVLSRIDTDHITFVDPLFKIYANVVKPQTLIENDDGYYIQ